MLAAALPLVAVHTASATDLASQKLFGRWTSRTVGGYTLGDANESAALSSKWAVVGAQASSDRGAAFEGAVQVFNAATGAWVRKITPPGGLEAGMNFGVSVAVSGDTLLVGAPGASAHRGTAFLYNLSTGALLRTLVAADGSASDHFGRAVTISGNVVAVSAPDDDVQRGAVYLFDLSTGLQLGKIVAGDGAANHFFGWSVAAEGNVLAVGAVGVDGFRGAVYLYDLRTQALIRRHQPITSVAGNEVGARLDMHQGRVVIGSLFQGKAWLYDLATSSDLSIIPPGATTSSYGMAVAIHGAVIAVGEVNSLGAQGSVHLFDSKTGAYLSEIVPPAGDINFQRFGTAVALDGPVMLTTAPEDGTQATSAGAAYLVRPITNEMPYTKVIAKGDYAPGTVDINIGTIGDCFVNALGKTIFTSTLSGAGALSSDSAAFSDVATAGVLELQRRSRTAYSAGESYAAISRVTMNDDNLAVGYSTLTGTGITAANNTVVWLRTNTFGSTLFRTGAGMPDFGGAVLATVPEVVTSNYGGRKRLAAVCTLKPDASVDATNDSRLYTLDVGGAADVSIREGIFALAPLGVSVKIGQIAPRVCNYYTGHLYSTALTSTDATITAANNAAIFSRIHNGTETLIQQKGDVAVNSAGLATADRFSSFISESSNGENATIYRAALAGLPAATNEGVWRYAPGTGRYRILQKGDTLLSPAGTKVAKIINFWGMGSSAAGSTQVLLLVQLAGTGVTASNDQALLLSQTDGTLLLLMREGDAAPGCTGTKIGTISRIDADAWSNSYAVIATLSGAPTGTELAMFTGNVGRLPALRLPMLRLRKGQLFDNQPSKVKSISLPTGNVTAGGAGCTGRGRAISYGRDFVFTVEFDNGVRQVMKGDAN
jgi:hypothetical protein